MSLRQQYSNRPPAEVRSDNFRHGKSDHDRKLEREALTKAMAAWKDAALDPDFQWDKKTVDKSTPRLTDDGGGGKVSNHEEDDLQPPQVRV